MIPLLSLLLLPFLAPQACADDALPRTAETFQLGSHKAFLYAAPKPAQGRPWVWYAPTLQGVSLVQRKAYFESFLRAGISIAGFDLGEVRGSPASTAKFTQFYGEMVKRGWSSRPILLGQSRGGLMMLAWAMRHPDKTQAFVGIYPVCNLANWPMKNKAVTLADYNLTEAELHARLAEFNPLDNLKGLLAHKVPMFVVHGDADAVVPYDENTRILKERYQAGGGPITVKLIAGEGHKVSPAFFECRELIDFVLQQAQGNAPSAQSPRMLLQGKGTSFALMRLPDGSFAFYNRNSPASGPLTLPDRDGRNHTLLPELPREVAENKAITQSDVLKNTQVIWTADKHVVSVLVQVKKLDKATAAKVGLPMYLDVWTKRASLAEVFDPHRIWRGYNGSQMEYQQLPGGRILVPYGSFQPHAKPQPPTGRHKTIIQYSDDSGRTWQESASQLTSPCYDGYNGSNEGACEPAIEPLRDGRAWMLMRTQAGFLYESHSDDQGATWRPATASRFNASTGPPNIMRHKNGWLVVCWNNCEMPPRHEGQGVYGGRDALHIAVSDDDGKTWRGFREIYLDHRRHDNPAKVGDRGTAYPLGAYTSDGKIVVMAGQGTGGRNPILVEPRWILDTQVRTDFSDGLAQWSVYKHHGSAARWWRAREVGCALIPHPDDKMSRCLHVRKPDELPADGATWNFPNGWQGSLTARIMLRDGSRGGMLCLNDRMFDPANDHGEELAVFRIAFGPDGRLGTARLTPDRWHDITLQWNLDRSSCHLLVDGADAGQAPLRHATLNGISYVRLRSAARAVDPAGFLVASVSVSVDNPVAPAWQPADLAAHERRYQTTVVPQWR